MKHITRHSLLLVLLVSSSCAESQSPGIDTEEGGSHPVSDGGGSSASTGGAPATPSSGGGGSEGVLEGSGGTGNVEEGPPPMLYMHTNSTLFQADPSSNPLVLSEVGDFDCVGNQGQDSSMTDIAVDENGALWGISKSSVYELTVSGSTVHCAVEIPLNNPSDIRFYGLSFAPKGVLDPTKEVLIAGNTAGELWSIDEDGNLEQRGTLGTVPSSDGNGHSYTSSNVGQAWELSGDIVFVENNGDPLGFATVRDCPDPPSDNDCNEIDTLVELDLNALADTTTGSVIKSVRGQIRRSDTCNDVNTGYGRVYGTAAFEDKVFGFSRAPDNAGGYAIDISNIDGSACLIQAFEQDFWSGAGISTIVQVEAPPPK